MECELSDIRDRVSRKTSIGEKYFIKVQDEIFWNIDPGYSFNTQYIDSLLSFETQLDSLLIVELQSLNDSLTITHEFIILDTISKSIARLNDSGPWAVANVNTIGSTNVISQNNYDSQLVPQLFVLYQNYPNPFNGQTKSLLTYLKMQNYHYTLPMLKVGYRIGSLKKNFIILGRIIFYGMLNIFHQVFTLFHCRQK